MPDDLFFPCATCGDLTLVLVEGGYECVDPACPSNTITTARSFDVCTVCCRPMTPRATPTCGCDDA